MKVQVEAEQSKVSGLVSQTANSIAGYANEIDAAEAEAENYENLIALQKQNIAALKKQLEEERRLSALAASSAKRDISEVTFADGDRYLLANLIYCEAGGEPYEGKVCRRSGGNQPRTQFRLSRYGDRCHLSEKTVFTGSQWTSGCCIGGGKGNTELLPGG